MAPRARLELAIRRGELTATRFATGNKSMDPIAAFPRLEFLLTTHRLGTRPVLFRVDKPPRAFVLLGVRR